MRNCWAWFLLLGLSVDGATGFDFVTAERVAPIVLAAGESDCVRLAADDLASDVKKITGRRPAVTCDDTSPLGPCVIVRTKKGGAWESYRVEEENGRLIIEGGDARGTMFGVYAFCEAYLKVDPLCFWSGREPGKRPTLAWKDVSLTSGSPAFKFRGWFINDEDLLTGWMSGGGERHIDYPFYGQVVNREAMRAVVEALVRSRFNLIIPASFIDVLNPPEAALVEECARRGVFVSQHHVEPMGVSAFTYFNYWKARGKTLSYSYFSHPDEVREVWRVYAKKWATYPNVIWQLGLRGIGDRPMWQADSRVPQSDEARGRIISDAMADQVKILDEVAPAKPRLMSTTLWAEGSVLNQKGFLNIPAGTIIVFADNSPGWKWQRDFYETPRDSAHRYGVYYHHGLIGSGPHLAQVVPPHKTFELLRTAMEKGAGEYAIFNVSNIREFVLGIDATARMTWRLSDYDPDAWLNAWAGDRFLKHAKELADAYRIYFNAYRIHDQQHVPFLMDGQMFGKGRTALADLAKKLNAGKIGTGTAPETILYADQAADAQKGSDAFWQGLGDTSPASLGRRETFKQTVAQQAGFELALLHARAFSDELTDDERVFLQDNLIYPCAIMQQTCAWLASLLKAQEALDLGDLPACVQSLDAAETAFGRLPVLAEGYCHGKWKPWYQGCRKLDEEAMLKKTHDVTAMASATMSKQREQH